MTVGQLITYLHGNESSLAVVLHVVSKKSGKVMQHSIRPASTQPHKDRIIFVFDETYPPSPVS